MTVRSTILDNGLRVVTEDRPQLETASVGVWVDVGARYEPPEANGVSHLLEHMAFKGTDRRTALDIAEEIEQVGGHLNAYTSREHTAYFAQVLKHDLPLAVDILADILQHSTFDEAELEREREVIVQEIGQAQDTPDDVIFDFLQETAFPDQPLGRSILGTVDKVRGYGREVLTSYMDQHYRAPRMVLAAAGRLDHEALVELAGEVFSGLAPADDSKSEPGSYGGGEKREVKDLEQVHIAFGFAGLAFDDPDYYALQVASAVLGGGMSSRLFQEVREKRGLAYSVYSFATAYTDGGLFGIYAGTGRDEAAELVNVVAGETARLARDAGDREVARARAQLKAGLLMSLESSANRCEQLARQTLIFGRVLPTEELIAKVEAVDVAAARAALERVLTAGAVTLAAYGPVERVDPYDRIAAKFA